MKIKKTTISIVTAGLLLSSMASASEIRKKGEPTDASAPAGETSFTHINRTPARETVEDVEPIEPAVPAEATSLAEAFTKGTPSGQIRLGYIWLDPEENDTKSTYDLALGGQLKFETASLYGVALGAAFYTSHSLLQPDEEDFNDELSSAKQHYDLLAEAFVNYSLKGFSIRAGRQLIDTPFADGDDIRMTPNTFEAVVGAYECRDFSVTGGYLSEWQGPDAGYHHDADFDDMVPGSDGTWMLGGGYGSDLFEAGFWYYGVVDVVNVFYGDIIIPLALGESMALTLGAQIALQSDSTNDETYAEIGSRVEGNLYGVMAEFSIAGITAVIAYDHASVDEGEALFGGFGGGPFFTNIDTLVANEFAAGQNADSYILSLGYDLSETGAQGLSIGYTFGHYKGGADAINSAANAEVEEHNFYVEYEITETWSLDAVYVVSDDKENQAATEWDYDRAQVRVNFTF